MFARSPAAPPPLDIPPPPAAPPLERPSAAERTGLLAAARRALLLLALAVLALLVGLLIYDSLASPVSTLMLARWASGRDVRRDAVPLSRIAPLLAQAVIASEDARFCLHAGVDWSAMRAVVAEAGDGGRSRGASTLDMQTVKNLFLWPGRSYLRKAIEIPLTLGLDLVWSKSRILNAYLNIAEWGDGIFGAEAASRFYFHKPAAALNRREAALLVAALPNPKKRDPRAVFRQGTGAAYARLAGKLMARLNPAAAPVACLGRGGGN